jgi:hypothetical protein
MRDTVQLATSCSLNLMSPAPKRVEGPPSAALLSPPSAAKQGRRWGPPTNPSTHTLVRDKHELCARCADPERVRHSRPCNRKDNHVQTQAWASELPTNTHKPTRYHIQLREREGHDPNAPSPLLSATPAAAALAAARRFFASSSSSSLSLSKAWYLGAASDATLWPWMLSAHDTCQGRMCVAGYGGESGADQMNRNSKTLSSGRCPCCTGTAPLTGPNTCERGTWGTWMEEKAVREY